MNTKVKIDYDKVYQEEVIPLLKGKESEREVLKAFSEDKSQKFLYRYIVIRQLMGDVHYREAYEEGRSYCEKWKPDPDDLLFRTLCVISEDKDYIRKKLDFNSLFGIVSQVDVPASIALSVIRAFLTIVNYQEDVQFAEEILSKALALEKFKDPQQAMVLKLMLASSYTYSSNPPELFEKARILYDELEILEEKYSIGIYTNVIYNKAYIYLVLQKKYKSAIKELEKLKFDNDLEIDRKISLAYAKKQLGKTDEAVNLVLDLKLTEHDFKIRGAFMHCYRNIVLFGTKYQEDMTPCVTLPEGTQSDVISDITEILAGYKLSPEIELKLWRQFWIFFINRLKPQFQNRVSRVFDLIEFDQLRFDSRLKDQEIEYLERFRIMAWSLVILSSLLVFSVVVVVKNLRQLKRKNKTIEDYSIQIREQHKELANILDNMQEGLLQLGSDLEFLEYSSSFTDTLFQKKPENLEQFLDFCGYDGDKKSLILNSMKVTIQGHEFSWDLNSVHFPNEVEHENRILSLHWQPVIANETIVRVIMTLRDVTELRELEAKEENLKKQVSTKQDILGAILSYQNKSKIVNFLSGFSDAWKIIRTEYKKKKDLKKLKREVHTLKGNARSYGLLPIQDAVHQLETHIKEGGNLEEYFDQFENRNEVWLDVLDMFQVEEVSVNLFEQIEDYLLEAKSRLDKAKVAWAAPLISISVSPDHRHYPQAIQTILIHGISNSCDHGYLRPIEGGWDFDKAVRLEIFVGLVEGEWCVDIKDNGFGLDLEAIKSKARGTKYEGLSVTEILAEDDFSTSKDVSLSSGRGVGMSAIASEIRSLSGQIEIKNREDNVRGSVLNCRWPA